MTNLQNCLGSCSIYVGTYKKYNNRSLYGKWLNFSDFYDYDELLTAMYELHSDEKDPAFMIQDYENCGLFEKLGLISECYLSKDIFDIAEQIDNSDYSKDIYEACIDCIGNMDFQTLFENVSNNYQGEFKNDIDFVQDLLEQTGDVPTNIPSYICIDWEATSRNIMFDYYESGGYYFRA